MNNKILFFLTICLILLLSCSKDIENKNDFKKLIFNKEKFGLTDSLNFKFIPLETNEECLIGSISSIKIADNKIFIQDIHKVNSLFVFNQNGQFITKVGSAGNAPTQYIDLFGFDIDIKRRLIILDDRHQKRLLFFDFDSYQFKYSLKINFNFANFQLLSNGNIAFFSYEGFDDIKTKGKSYLLVTDSLGKPIDTFYKTDFSTSLTYSNSTNRIYSLKDKFHVFHHLFPYIYEINKKTITPTYELKFKSFKFPTIEYLKKESENNKEYTNSLARSGMISSYSIYESSNIICCPFVCDKQLFIGLYNKEKDTGYIFSIPDFYRESKLGVFLNPKGATEDYIICTVQPEDIKKVKNNSILKYLSPTTSEDNPTLCLFKLK
ncbi:6-bladed beta-propeller [Parabacteroides segnis]|uniref:6-bladed beta-propeller n=1 Tax=Parabacteroides segnis TaxID=2763058 RepID=UPI0035199E3F